MRKIFFLLLIVCATSSAAQVKLKHGLLLGGGGKGLVSGATYPLSDDYWDGRRKRACLATNKANYMLGYKFRIKRLKQKLFYDIDLLIGGRNVDYVYYTEDMQTVRIPSPNPIYGSDIYSSLHYGYAALSLTYNYQTYKGFYAGAGISSEYHYFLAADGGGINAKTITTPDKIDIPVILKMGYELKGIDFSFSYRIGTTNMVASDIVKHGRINEWRVQLFIPF